MNILAEQALIVWDPGAHRQHFIRRARFAAAAADFGFLVPTPARPELAEAPDSVFDRLREAIQPEVVHLTGLKPAPFALVLLPFMFVLKSAPLEDARAPAVAAGAPQAPPPVRVLEEKRVAGYEAAVLQADDAGALLGWLEQHHYDARPELLEWLRPYVAQHWTITAFKVSGANAAPTVATQAVRMSFATERPFFPYREPADQRTGPSAPRELVVFLVAPGRMKGTIGSDGDWPAQVPWAAPRPGLESVVAPALPPGAALPAGAWLNAFIDEASPRPGTDDLFFAPARTQQMVKPPPIIVDERTVLPIPVDLAAGVVGAWWWRRRRARRRRG